MEFFCDNSRHLVCKPYSIVNLHLMAEELKIKKIWFHRTHYDIPKKRIQEIQTKCIIITTKKIINIINGEKSI